MKKDAKHISLNTVRATFVLYRLMVLGTQCQKQASRVFRHTAALNFLGISGGRVFILVMTAFRNFTFNWILTMKTPLWCLLIQLTN